MGVVDHYFMVGEFMTAMILSNHQLVIISAMANEWESWPGNAACGNHSSSWFSMVLDVGWWLILKHYQKSLNGASLLKPWQPFQGWQVCCSTRTSYELHDFTLHIPFGWLLLPPLLVSTTPCDLLTCRRFADGNDIQNAIHLISSTPP